MIPKTILFPFALLLLFARPLSGQYVNVWSFGKNAGIDFNSTPPVAIKTGISTSEGSATICDDKGTLLFYTDGTTVWDRTHTVMPNGSDLIGKICYDNHASITNSTSQGTIIIPLPDEADQYYVFSLGAFECEAEFGKLYYSVIDMSLNNGLGDVVHDKKGILFAENLTEHMYAVNGRHCDIWLVVVSEPDTSFRAYNINYNGLATTPTISPRLIDTRDSFRKSRLGCIDISPDGRKLAIAQGSLVLYDFDRNTGSVTNPLVLNTDSFRYRYGVCFSPDNSKLYVSDEAVLFMPTELLQFDLSAGDTTAIIKSKTRVGGAAHATHIRRAPDDKLYISGLPTVLGIINEPNLAGENCAFTPRGLRLVPETGANLGLPNYATIVPDNKKYNTTIDTLYCIDSFLLEAKLPIGVHYLWNDGLAADKRWVSQTGTYWLSYQQKDAECIKYFDTFHIVFADMRRIFTTTVADALCAADSILIQPKMSGAPEYLWDDLTQEPERTVYQKGKYWVNYYIDSSCTAYSDTFDIRYPEKDPKLSFAIDTLICLGDTVHFMNNSDTSFNRFQWHYGNGAGSPLHSPEYAYTRAGRYEVKLLASIGDKCLDSLIQYIEVDAIYPLSFLKDKDMICQGASVMFTPRVDNQVMLLHWRFGPDDDWTTPDMSAMRHAFSLPGTFVVQLTAQNRVCPATQFQDTVRVLANPIVYLGPDTLQCWQGGAIFLSNKASQTDVAYHYLWNTGATTEHIKVVHPGEYTLRVSTDSLGCATSETIYITKDCMIDIPNGFTPNGDGHNDYFLPRQVLASGIETYQMRIYNRWGQLIFDTHSIDGRGWDGRFNGQLQPQGTYLYMIDVHHTNGVSQQYRGNITLIR